MILARFLDAKNPIEPVFEYDVEQVPKNSERVLIHQEKGETTETISGVVVDVAWVYDFATPNEYVFVTVRFDE